MLSVRERVSAYLGTGQPERRDESRVVACYLRRDGMTGVWLAPAHRADPRVGDWLVRQYDAGRAWAVLTEADLV